MHRPLVSVIVPVYNGQTFLNRCIDSIRGQTYENIELLLIDDGSTDKSYEICTAYAQQDDRIRVLQQENKGVSAARNRGIECATGEFITFCDCDDELKSDYLVSAISDCEKFELDLWIGTTVRLVNGIETGRNEPWKRFLANTDELTEEQMLSVYYATSCISAKLWRRSFVGEVRFLEEMNYGEDLIFTQTVMLQRGRMMATPVVVYIYHLQSTGITSSISEKKVKSIVRCALLLREYATHRRYTRDGEFYRILDSGWCRDLYFTQMNILRSPLTWVEKRKYLRILMENKTLKLVARKENSLNLYPFIRYIMHYFSSALETIKANGCSALLRRVKGYLDKR